MYLNEDMCLSSLSLIMDELMATVGLICQLCDCCIESGSDYKRHLKYCVFNNFKELKEVNDTYCKYFCFAYILRLIGFWDRRIDTKNPVIKKFIQTVYNYYLYCCELRHYDIYSLDPIHMRILQEVNEPNDYILNTIPDYSI